MKTLIIYHTEHHGNTEKVAKAMAETVNAVLVRSEDFDLKALKQAISQYDCFGLGSGIYSGRHHKIILDLVDGFPDKFNKKVFIFSTSGVDALSHGYHNLLKNALNSKGINIAGEFNCLGFDTALISSGINHGKPDEKDFDDARKFVKNLTD